MLREAPGLHGRSTPGAQAGRNGGGGKDDADAVDLCIDLHTRD